MTGPIYQTFGALTFPVEPGVSLEPARDGLLEFFAAAINAELGEWWAEASAGLKYGDQRAVAALPVADTLPDVPDLDVMRARKCAFPLLALHPKPESEFSSPIEHESEQKREWHLHYVLGPAEIGTRRRLLDIFTGIAKLLPVLIDNGGHVSFDGGANQLEKAGVSDVALKGMLGPGQAIFGDDSGPRYWAAQYTVEMTERSKESIDHLPLLNAIDLSIDADGANDPNMSYDFIESSSDAEYQGP